MTHSNSGGLKDQSKDNEGNAAEQRKPQAKSVTLIERTIYRNSGITPGPGVLPFVRLNILLYGEASPQMRSVSDFSCVSSR